MLAEATRLAAAVEPLRWRSASLGPGLDGILVVAKPAGPTSHDVVALVRRLAATKRVGHGGTLDPFASGVLPIFLGHATRVVEYHLGDRKAYRATVCFGASSTTDDLEGELTPVSSGPAPTRDAVEAALAESDRRDLAATAGLQRDQGRRPARLRDGPGRRDGRPRARARSRSTRSTLVSWDGTDPDRPIAVVDVACSAGTYVRALARDLGEAVGSAAYLGALTRTASGPFELDDATALDDAPRGGRRGPAGLLPVPAPDRRRASTPSRSSRLTAEEVAADRPRPVRPARRRPASGRPTTTAWSDPDGALVAIATATAGRLAPDKVFVAPGAAAAVVG